LPASKLGIAIELTGLAALTLNLFVVARIAALLSGDDHRVITVSIFLTALYFPLLRWGTSGLEVPVLTLVVSVATLRALGGVRRPWEAWSLYALLAIGTFLRLDMVVPAVSISLFLWFTDRERRGLHLRVGLPLILGALMLQTFWRWHYYGELLPN